jgi:hypothetical protein
MTEQDDVLGKGTGLGLATISRIVPRAGGDVSLDRTDVAGTTDEGAAMIGRVPADILAALSGVLEDGEQVLGGLTSLSASLVLTDRHLAIIREGRTFRPRTGLRTWSIDRSFAIQAAPRGSAGAVIFSREGGATSFFVSADDWPDALRIVTAVRRLSAKSRRYDPG